MSLFHCLPFSTPPQLSLGSAAAPLQACEPVDVEPPTLPELTNETPDEVARRLRAVVTSGDYQRQYQHLQSVRSSSPPTTSRFASSLALCHSASLKWHRNLFPYKCMHVTVRNKFKDKLNGTCFSCLFEQAVMSVV